MNSMRVICNKEDLLKTIRKNREQHQGLVKEAREGYLKRGIEVLSQKLDELNNGKLAKLYFSLSFPEDHTAEYDTAIKMLELHQEETIELGASEVSCFINDDWQWKQAFIRNNAMYSAGTAALVDE